MYTGNFKENCFVHISSNQPHAYCPAKQPWALKRCENSTTCLLSGQTTVSIDAMWEFNRMQWQNKQSDGINIQTVKENTRRVLHLICCKIKFSLLLNFFSPLWISLASRENGLVNLIASYCYWRKFSFCKNSFCFSFTQKVSCIPRNCYKEIVR